MCSGKPDLPSNPNNQQQHPGNTSMQPHRSNSNPSEEWLQYLRNSQLVGGNVPPNEPAIPFAADQQSQLTVMARGMMSSMSGGDFLPPAAPQPPTLTSSHLAEFSAPSLLQGVELSLRQQQAIHELYQEQRILDVHRLMQQDYLMNWTLSRATTQSNTSFPASVSLDAVRRSHWPSMERQLLSPFAVRDAALDNPGRLSQIVDLLGQVTAANRRESPSATADVSSKQTPIFRSNNSPREYENDDGSDSKPAAKKRKGGASSPSGSSPPPGEKAFPSERQNLGDLTAKSHSPSQAQHVLKVLGTTLRCKADPFVDATILPVQSADPIRPKSTKKRAPGGLSSSFPEVLYELLETADNEQLDDIVSWLPHRRAFRVNNKDRFMQEILPRYFKGQNRWSSFLRQLNLYGFARVAKGPDYGAYYHELFVGGRPDLTVYMHRVGTPKGLDRRTFKLAEGDDPNFYDLSPVVGGVPSSSSVAPSSSD